jgi:hypothetical protein
LDALLQAEVLVQLQAQMLQVILAQVQQLQTILQAVAQPQTQALAVILAKQTRQLRMQAALVVQV